MHERPRVLIEDWLPVTELGIESRRESAPIPGQFPKLKTLHVWWARRPLAASAGAVLGSVMPTWSSDLASAFPDRHEVRTEDEYKAWFLRLCGILGDPIAAKRQQQEAIAAGVRIPNPYSYKQAFKNSPTTVDLELLHLLLERTWGRLPSVVDPTAGGGSIPYEASRYGLPVTANDLNPVAAAILRVGIEIPAKYGRDLLDDLERWGKSLTFRLTDRLSEFFPSGPGEQVATFLFARVVSCPRTGKPVPLSPNWWLSKENGGTAVRLVTERAGKDLPAPEFEIVRGEAIGFDPAKGTVAGGDGVSPWDGLVIDGDYIKAEAQAGRMASVLYAVAARVNGKRIFRPPTASDLNAIAHAESELQRLLPEWEQKGIIPDEEVPPGNDERPRHYGMLRWRDMFSSRQLLGHGVFVEEFRRLIPEVRASVSDPVRADAILALLAMLQAKAINWNAHLSSWDVSRQKLRSVFDRHDFAFKWTYAEFEGAQGLWLWCLDQLLDAYTEIAGMLAPADSASMTRTTLAAPVPGPAVVTRGTAGDLQSIGDHTQHLVCIDPPYYKNVMYAELSDFFYVWEKRTIGLLWPEMFDAELTDKKSEAVANEARFADEGRRRKDLARADYEAKMTAIFAECHRILRDDGVLTVMFTNQDADAWDTLGMALMEGGFIVETSWPVPTESEQSLHQAKKNAAASTIFLVCRKRPDRDEGSAFFEDVEADVRLATREALARFSAFGLNGVDLLLSTYGPALSVISSHWPVYSSDADPTTGRSRLLRPEEALDAARGELVRLQRQRLIGREARLDPISDFVLLAWEIFQAREFPFDEARRLALAVGGLDIDQLVRARMIEKKSGTVVLTSPDKRVRRSADHEAGLPGVYLDARVFPVVIDAVHTAMHLAEQDGPTAAKAWIDRAGLADDQRFLAALQGLVNAMPRTKTKEKWDVPEAEWLDAVRFYFPDVTVPDARVSKEAGEQGEFDINA